METRNITQTALVEQQQALEEYENPPIAESLLQRYSNAVNYTRVRGWSQRKACMKAGIDRSSIKRCVCVC
jgi:hypothetical protein